jgi:ABC-type transport system involved in Fe-S cluster assembly fused permease/ATPase subunit
MLVFYLVYGIMLYMKDGYYFIRVDIVLLLLYVIYKITMYNWNMERQPRKQYNHKDYYGSGLG